MESRPAQGLSHHTSHITSYEQSLPRTWTINDIPAIRNITMIERERFPNSSGASDSKKVTPMMAKSIKTIAMMKNALSTGMIEAGVCRVQRRISSNSQQRAHLDVGTRQRSAGKQRVLTCQSVNDRTNTLEPTENSEHSESPHEPARAARHHVRLCAYCGANYPHNRLGQKQRMRKWASNSTTGCTGRIRKEELPLSEE